MSFTRTREEQASFRESLYQEQRRVFTGIPLFCSATLLGYPRTCRAEPGPKVVAHHIRSYALTGNNDVTNGILLAGPFHDMLHELVNVDMNNWRIANRKNPYESGIDFVLPVTKAVVTGAFDTVLMTRRNLRNVVIKATGEYFVDVWEQHLLSKNLLNYDVTV